MDWPDVAGHVGYALLVWSQVLIGNRNPAGWAVYFVANAIWLGIGWTIGMSSIWFWEIIFLGLAVRNYLKWRQGSGL